MYSIVFTEQEMHYLLHALENYKCSEFERRNFQESIKTRLLAGVQDVNKVQGTLHGSISTGDKLYRT